MAEINETKITETRHTLTLNDREFDILKGILGNVPEGYSEYSEIESTIAEIYATMSIYKSSTSHLEQETAEMFDIRIIDPDEDAETN